MAGLLPGYALLYCLSGVASLTIAVVCWRQRQQPGAGLLAGMMVALAIWATGDAIDLAATAPSIKILGGKLATIGVATAPVFFFLAVLDFAAQRQWLTYHVAALLFLVPTVTIFLALTNEMHGIQWGSFEANRSDPNILVYGREPWFWVQIPYSYGISFFGVLMLFHAYMRQKGPFRAQVLALMAAVLATLLTTLIYLAPWNPVPGVDFSPLAFTLTGTILALSIAHFKLFDLAPIARDTIIETMVDAVLVLDSKRRIVDLNPAAQALLAWAPRSAIGQPVSLALPSLSVVGPADHRPVELMVDGSTRTYDVHTDLLYDRKQNTGGQVVVLHDVTERRQLAAALQTSNFDLETAVAERTARLQAAVTTLEQEIARRRLTEAQLRALHGSLASHVADLSHKLGAIYEVILFGGQAIAIPAIQTRALDVIMEAMHSDAGFVSAWDDAGGDLLLVAQRGFEPEQLAQLATLQADWLLADRAPRNIRELASDLSIPAMLRLPGPRAYLGQPTFLHNKPTGALGVFWRETRVSAVEDIALFGALADQLAIVVENARLRKERETAVVREERRRLARDLHDSVSQTLYGLAVAADTANNRARQGHADRVGGLLEQVANSAQQALREMRLLLYELHLATPNEMNLANALQLRLDAVERRAGLDAELQMDTSQPLPKNVERELYWIAMEALNNALKHAHATRVTVRVWEEAGAIAMEIKDNGIGLETPVRQGGIGLHSMAERAQRLGGAVTVSGGVQAGTCICVHLPATALV